jgi:hypothetical protein
MGTWGTAISSNDTYADVYGTFFELFDGGKEVEEITLELMRRFAETLADPYENHDFWFALAKAQWECKKLEPEVFDRVSSIIESGDNACVWRELGASESDLRKRNAVLDKFLVRLQSERATARTRKKKIMREPAFKKGECLTFRLSNENYGGAVVLEAINGSEYNYNLIVTTRINQAEIPTIDDFVEAQVLIADYADWKNELAIMWYLPVRHKKVSHLIQSVGTIPIQRDFPLKSSNFGRVADLDVWLIDHANRQFASEAGQRRRAKKRLIQEFIKRSRWKFWS